MTLSNLATPQGMDVDFALHTLGWKGFQDLAIAVAAEVLERPVQIFLPSKDGGRDGAFVGTWKGAPDVPNAKSTIQCKFTGKHNTNLTLNDVKGELSKVRSLAQRGLAHDYILLTNMGISGQVESEVSAAFQHEGATTARVFGREWLTQEIRQRPRLRMMVPRLYGLGDLSQIIDERAYLQARYILSSMGEDLAAFVTTLAHRQSVEALRKHNFVLLLGDPASGKSTIGASLGLGALDDGAIGTVRISTGDAFEQHWNPKEPGQFFWIDDAFGETQYQRSRVDGWNSRLKVMRAAVKAGARILMTSRTYIWNAAQRDLKFDDFPLLTNSQVIIDVQGLSDVERAQILYNHLRLGDQSKEWRKDIKPFLPDIATNPRFLPETARRLGSKFFTSKLTLSPKHITSFVEEPIDFLKGVLQKLAEPERAAVALIFLHGENGVASPIISSEELNTVCRLSGLTQAQVARALEVLAGSLTLLLESETGRRWVFKHPTIADAYAALVAESPEMIELYIRGAKLEKLFSEVVCGAVQLTGASVHVPHTLYDVFLDRMEKKGLLHVDILRFATFRGDLAFIEKLLERGINLSEIPARITSEMRWSVELNFLANLHARKLLPEAVRLSTIERVSELTLFWADSTVFREVKIRSLFTNEEFEALGSKFEKEIIEQYGTDPGEWLSRISTSDPVQLLKDLKGAINDYSQLKPDVDYLQELAENAAIEIDDYIRSIDDQDSNDGGFSSPISPKVGRPSQISAIFDDIDE